MSIQETKTKPPYLIRTVLKAGLPLFNREIGFKVQRHKLNDDGDMGHRWHTVRFFYDDYSEHDKYKPSLVRRFRQLTGRK